MVWGGHTHTLPGSWTPLSSECFGVKAVDPGLPLSKPLLLAASSQFRGQGQAMLQSHPCWLPCLSFPVRQAAVHGCVRCFKSLFKEFIRGLKTSLLALC